MESGYHSFTIERLLQMLDAALTREKEKQKMATIKMPGVKVLMTCFQAFSLFQLMCFLS